MANQLLKQFAAGVLSVALVSSVAAAPKDQSDTQKPKGEDVVQKIVKIIKDIEELKVKNVDVLRVAGAGVTISSLSIKVRGPEIKSCDGLRQGFELASNTVGLIKNLNTLQLRLGVDPKVIQEETESLDNLMLVVRQTMEPGKRACDLKFGA